MRHFPAFLNLAGRQALVIGSGEIAQRKAAVLAAAGALVRTAHSFSDELLQDCAIAIGADAPDAELIALSLAARRRGIPVNVVDRPELCSFIMPALVDRDPVMVAISTGGTSPVLARLLRQQIERLIPPAIGRLAMLIGEVTAEIRRRWPDFSRRRRVLERLLTGRVAELVFAGEDAAAREAVRCEIGSHEANPDCIGTVFLVGAGPGAADLLTSRAHRLLGEADVVVHDRLVDTEVLALAR